VAAGITETFWLQLSIGSLWAHPDALSASMFPLFMFFEIFNVGDAVGDMRTSWR
jgi:hypothetical protein